MTISFQVHTDDQSPGEEVRVNVVRDGLRIDGISFGVGAFDSNRHLVPMACYHFLRMVQRYAIKEETVLQLAQSPEIIEGLNNVILEVNSGQPISPEDVKQAVRELKERAALKVLDRSVK